MDRSRLIERVNRLLSLATSDNEHEAASAAAIAQRLISRYEMDVSELAGEREPESLDDYGPLGQTSIDMKTLPAWMGQLAVVVAEVNHCFCTYARGRALNVVGREAHRQTTAYLFNYLIREINRVRMVVASQTFSSKGRRWHDSFRLGASTAVITRLREARAGALQEAYGDASGDSVELVRLDRRVALLRDASEEAKHRALGGKKAKYTRRRRSNTLDVTAWLAGAAAGKDVSLGGEARARIA